MFSTFTSFILGTNSNTFDTSTNPNLDASEQQHHSIDPSKLCNLNIIVKDLNDEDDEHNDWLFVDREDATDSAPQTDSEEELPFVEIKNAPPIVNRRGHSRNNSNGAGTHDGLLSLSPTSIQPNSMEESWFVTPPPCFTSTGPIIMETSPLENLLIEHPSMSVYHRATSTLRDNVDDDDDDDMVVVLDLTSATASEPMPASMMMITPAATIATAPRTANGSLHPAADRSPNHTVRITRRRTDHVEHVNSNNNNNNNHQIKQYLLQKNISQNNDHKAHQFIRRRALERSNKVREVNCKGGRQKRSDMNHCKVISRANNDRKC